VKRFVITALLLAGCAGPPTPKPQEVPEAQAPGAQKTIGTVRVTANSLNVRRDASASGEVIAQVRKGERLALLSATDEWDRVRLGNGDIGFVSAQHVIREGMRARRGCPSDSDFSFAKSPVPAFSENATAHGIVAVEANVDARGTVTATRVVTNTTGDESLGALSAREIRDAKFVAPIRNCVAKPFIFTYKRSF
jgi:uncharacterized protein YgiM (DUF1202 family)